MVRWKRWKRWNGDIHVIHVCVFLASLARPRLPGRAIMLAATSSIRLIAVLSHSFSLVSACSFLAFINRICRRVFAPPHNNRLSPQVRSLGLIPAQPPRSLLPADPDRLP